MKEINQNSTSPGVPQPGLSKHSQREERWVLFMQFGGHQLFQIQSGALNTLGKNFTTYQCHFPNPLNYILIITNTDWLNGTQYRAGGNVQVVTNWLNGTQYRAGGCVWVVTDWLNGTQYRAGGNVQVVTNWLNGTQYRAGGCVGYEAMGRS